MIKALTLYAVGMLVTVGIPFLHYTYMSPDPDEKYKIAIMAVILACVVVSFMDKFWRRPRRGDYKI